MSKASADTQTLLYHGIPALGVPGASNWKAAWAEHLKGKTVFAWQEPDDSRRAVCRQDRRRTCPTCASSSRPTATRTYPPAHIAGFDIPALVARLKAEARPYRELAAEHLSAEAAEAEKAAAGLLKPAVDPGRVWPPVRAPGPGR